MAKIRKGNLFFKQSVIFFGFLSGFWTAIGINPEKIIFGYWQPFVAKLGANALYLFGILPFILLIVSLYLIYTKAKWLGFIAVIFGYLGGLVILVSPVYSVILLIIAWIIGYFAVN